MAASFLAGPLKSRADSVYLHSVTDIYQTDSASVYPGDSYWGPATDFTRYDTRYTRGLGYRQDTTSTNYNSRNYSANGTAKTDGCLNYSSFVLTNSITNGWLNGALTSGPNTLNTIYTESRWTNAGGNWTHSITLSIPDGDTNNSFSPPPSSQFQPAYYRGMDYVATTVEPNGDGGTNTTVTTMLVTHTVKLETDAPTGGTGSALYRLTSGFDIPSGTNVNVLAENAAKYSLAGETPDTNGVVWKIFTDGTTNDVSVRIRDDYACDVTNFTFNPTPYRATLGIQWKSAATNDTNWQSGPLYVLKGTTVLFRVQATAGGTVETNVAWPTGTPAWNAGTNLSEQISVTFDTLSTTTNGHWITVTAGSMASNQVVVYDFKIVPTAKSLVPTPRIRSVFGVGEEIDFTTDFVPGAFGDSFPYSFSWSGNGTANTNGLAAGDISTFSGQTLSAGCLGETNTITAALNAGINMGVTRTTNVVIIAPTNVVMLSIRHDGELYYTNNPNVGHTQYIPSCVKAAHYQVLPLNVSFMKIKIAEGVAPYSWIGGTNDIPHEVYQNGVWTPIGNTNLLPTPTEHPQFEHRDVSFALTPTGYHHNTVIVSHDRFGYESWTGRTPSVAKTNTIEIPVTYILAVKTNALTKVESTKILGPQGRVKIKKDGLEQYTKEFTDPDSPE